MKTVNFTDGSKIEVCSYTSGILHDDVNIITMMVPVISGSGDTQESILAFFSGKNILNVTDENGNEEPLPDTFTSLLPDSVGFDPQTLSLEDETIEKVYSVAMMSDVGFAEYLDNFIFGKISELSSICREKIEIGLTLELSSGTKTFSYNADDRENIKQMFDAVMYGATSFPYHGNNESCEPYSAADIIKIYTSMVKNKTHHTTYFNQMKQYVLSLNNVLDISKVEYGQALTGTYLEIYNQNMNAAETEMNNILAKVGVVS